MASLHERIGKRLRELRRARALTQEQLAERSGLSHKFIGEIERAQANPTVATLGLLSQALGVEVCELFSAPSDSVQALGLYLISPNELALVRDALTTADTVLGKVGSGSSGRRRGRTSHP